MTPMSPMVLVYRAIQRAKLIKVFFQDFNISPKPDTQVESKKVAEKGSSDIQCSLSQTRMQKTEELLKGALLRKLSSPKG